MKLLKETNIFDFIHAVQMNCESSQLDKENAHFVLADMAISSIELIKTQHAIENSEILTPQLAISNGTPAFFIPNHQRHASAAASTSAGGLMLRNRLASAAIRINNQSVTSSNIRSFEDRSNTNSLQTNRDSFRDDSFGASGTNRDSRASIVSGSLKRFQNRLRSSFSTSSLNSLMRVNSNNKENLIITMNRKIFDRNSRTSIDTLVFKSNDTDTLQKSDAEAKRKHWLLTNETVNKSTASGNSDLFELSIESTSDGVNVSHNKTNESGESKGQLEASSRTHTFGVNSFDISGD
jgi:hypothetical protein